MRTGSLAASLEPTRRLTASALTVPLAGLVGLVVGAALVAKPQLVVLMFLAGLGVIGIAVAFTRPALTFVGLVLIVALLPSYAGPSMGPILFIPGAGASWAIAVAIGWRNLLERGRILRPTAIDAAFGLFVLLMAVSLYFSPRTGFHEFIHVMFLWAGPFLGARLLLAEVENPLRTLALGFAIAVAIVSPIAISEYFGGSNPFHSLNFNSAEYSVWASQAARFGEVRAEASFGHPIALSMFASASALLSLTMALKSTAKRERNLWFASGALGVAVQALTVSRTGWLMLLIGGVLLVVLYARGDSRRRLLSVLGTIGVVLVLASILVPSAVQVLPGFEKHEGEVASSGDYRHALLKRALEPGVLNPWGNAQNEVTPYVNFGTATDNEYILLADLWGLIPMTALILVGLSMLWAALRYGWHDPGGQMAIPIAGFASFAALFFVAFITQQQVVVWLLAGCAAVATEQVRESLRASRAAARRAAAQPRERM